MSPAHFASTLAVGLLALAGTAQDPVPTTPTHPAPPVNAAAEAHNRFALELFARLRTEPGNRFVAPISIRTALAMTALGARGDTARQMQDVLHCGASAADSHAVAALAKSFAANDPGLSFSRANALWIQDGMPVLDTFTGACRDEFDAAAELVDFVGANEAARTTINEWVAARTRDRIPELLKPGILSPDTRLVLTDAVDFVGRWAQPFDAERTKPAAFVVRSASADAPAVQVTVPTMVGMQRAAFFADETVTVAELAYAGDEYAMLIVLPASSDGLPVVEAALTADRLAAWCAGMRPQNVLVRLPRFSFRDARTLNEPLRQLGMTDAFESKQADFSGITGKRDLMITAVVHEAFVAVDELGTEASAATGVVMGRTGAPQQLRVNHPFLFAIRHRASGALLFLGRVADPSAKA